MPSVGQIEKKTQERVAMRGIASLDIFVRPGASQAQRAAVLDRWYREQLKALVKPMFATWQAKLGVQASAWGVKRMKTKWGSCTPASRRVWLNSELAKKPVECIEYIVVHELLHLSEPNHGTRFIALMNRQTPTALRIAVSRFLSGEGRDHVVGVGFLSESGLQLLEAGLVGLAGTAYYFPKRESPKWSEDFSGLFTWNHPNAQLGADGLGRSP
jgi:hypothetical protein